MIAGCRSQNALELAGGRDDLTVHYRGLDSFAFHEEYAKFDRGIDERLLGKN